MNSTSSKQQIFILLLSLIPEAILESILIPLYPYIVRHLLPNEPEQNIGHYVGLLGSAFYFPLFFMNLIWGTLSDRIGAKPILLMGLVVCFITTIIIGTTNSYTMVWFCRFFAGVFGANSTVAKGMLGNLAREAESRAWGYAMYGSVYGLSGFIGPILGGLLSNPVQIYPGWFEKEGIFAKYPYLLTCLLGAGLCLISLYSTVFWLKEHSTSYSKLNDDDNSDVPMEDFTSLDHSPSRLTSRSPERRPERQVTLDIEESKVDRVPAFSFLSRSTLGPICMYMLIAYTNMAYFTSIPLFYSAPHDDGGLGLDSRDTSLSLTVISGSKLFIQLIVFQKLFLVMKDSRKTYRLGMSIFIPMHLLIPMLYLMSSFGFTLFNVLLMVAFGCGESISYLSVILRITESNHVKNLGIAHGFASTVAALVRTIAPSSTGYIWEYGRQMGWSSLVFFLGSLTSLAGVIASWIV